jgi:hypothetical protein
MSYTSHGHHIPGTPKHTKPPLIAKCGGAMACAHCAKETAAKLIELVESTEDQPAVQDTPLSTIHVNESHFALEPGEYNLVVFQHGSISCGPKPSYPDGAVDPPVTHSESTLFRAREALLKIGISEQDADNGISEILNAGVVFREPVFGEPVIGQEQHPMAQYAEKDAAETQAAWQQPREDGNLVAHARRELQLLGEEPETIEWYLSVVRAVAAFGHSGGSASVMIPILNDLLQFKNLKPLTDNPDEWMDRERESGYPLWQNVRTPDAFSEDGGKTYWRLNGEDTKMIYNSEPHAKVSETVSGG